MKRYYSKWSDRRTAQGSLKPFIYLVIEFIVLLMLCWFVSLFDILIITIFAGLGAMYFFMTSSLPRYNKVKNRQKYSKYQ